MPHPRIGIFAYDAWKNKLGLRKELSPNDCMSELAEARWDLVLGGPVSRRSGHNHPAQAAECSPPIS